MRSAILPPSRRWPACALLAVTANQEARVLLMQAHRLHAERRMDDALAAARGAIELDPDYVDAWSFLGTTLVTRKLAFEEGLAALERAAELAPDDAGIVYGLGWCYEFVAHRLERLRPEASGEPAQPYRDPIQLYHRAAECLRRTVELDPEEGLKNDAADLLDAIEVRLER